MKPSADTVQASYRFCRRVCRQANSNFAFSFLFLPRAKRRAMTALYAFMRHTDDLVDNQQPGQLRSEALLRWRAALEETLLGNTDAPEDHQQQLDRPHIPGQETGRAVLPALADTIRQFAIPAEHLRAVIDGVEMDLARRRYETFEELQQYCERVASAVGLACLHVWGFHGQPALEPARKCGVALQLTNILRDLKDDARADRVYLPLADLRQCRYSVDDLKQAVVDERFQRLMQLQVDRAEEFFREGAELLRWLEPDGQRISGMMMATYHALLKKIRRRPHDVFARRICVGRLEKLRIAARWTLLPTRPAPPR
jgi:phytoene synthase